ncbi:zinc finger, CCHC-type containing protein [Tanacetum coccineum]
MTTSSTNIESLHGLSFEKQKAPRDPTNLENLHANDMLKELKTLFAQQAEQELLQTTRDFHACKQEEGQSVSSYVLRMKGKYLKSTRSLAPRDNCQKETKRERNNFGLASLRRLLNEVACYAKAPEQTHKFLPNNNAPKRNPALHAIRAGKVQKGKKHKPPQPQMVARGQNQGNGKHKHAFAPKPKIPPPPKKEDPAKDSICHECGETGHWKRNCPQYLAEFAKEEKETQPLELVVVQGLRASRKLKPRALSLYVGNGQRELRSHPSIDTSSNHEEDDLEMDNRKVISVPFRKGSTRTRRPTIVMLFVQIDAEEHELGISVPVELERVSAKHLSLHQSAEAEYNLLPLNASKGSRMGLVNSFLARVVPTIE